MARKTTDDAAVPDTIAGLEPLHDMAAWMHEAITAAAPELEPRLWYGMPGYAEKANLAPPDGARDLDEATEARIADIVTGAAR